MGSETKRLRILTYMCPELPVDIFILVRDYLEEATGRETDLTIEDRFTGPRSTRTDPFLADLADIVVLHSTAYLRLKDSNHEEIELCPAAPVHDHPMVADRPVYFSEILIHSSNKGKFKEIKDLKGCSWAYNDHTSLSGNLIVLKYLKETLKTNASYFGAIVESGSHLNSIKMVRDKRVDAAAVDSTVLAGYLREHEDHKEKFTSLVSLGPMPIYPFVFNKRLSADVKQKITDALLSMHKVPKWAARLKDIGIKNFTAVGPDTYALEEEVKGHVSGLSINPSYY